MGEQAWVLVINGSEGRIYARNDANCTLQPVPGAEFIGDKRRSRDINTDRQGRKPHNTNMSMAEPVDDPQLVAKRRFMHEVANFLDKARVEHRLSELILIAPPQILGLLRNELSQPLAEMVVFELNKDLTAESATQVLERLMASKRQEADLRRWQAGERALRRGA